MITRDNAINLELSRRKLLAAAGIVGGAAVAASLCGSGTALAAPATPSSAVPPTTPPVAGLHLQFGTDAASEMVVSWHTLQPVGNPRVMLRDSRWPARPRSRGERDQLHRRKVGSGCLCLSCERSVQRADNGL